MKKEIILYSGVYDFVAASFIKEMEANKGNDIVIRMNTPGGDVLSTFGMVAKFQEHTKGKSIKVDGRAASAGAFMLLFAENVEALDVSEILFHRAAYSSWIESSKDYFTDERKAELKKVNDNLRAAMEGRFTATEWQDVTGVSLDDLFSLDSRIDVKIDAYQAQKLGIVYSVTKITPAKKAEITALSLQMVAFSAPEAKEPQQVSNTTTNKMTIEKLKAEHPDVFAAAVKEGVTQERDRAGAYLAFIELDPEAVKKGITGGDVLTATQMAEFSMKAFSKAQLNATAGDNAVAIETGEEKKGATKDDVAAKAFDEEWKAILAVK